MADIILRSPFSELRRLLDGWEDDRPAGRLFPRLSELSLIEEGALALDVEKTDGTYVVNASVPGFKRDEIQVKVDDGVLSISAERSEEKEETKKQYVRRERYTGSLMRQVSLPGIGGDANVDATLKDGVLRVEVAVPERTQAKQIEVREG